MMMNTSETFQSEDYEDDGILLHNTSNINTQEILSSGFYIEIVILIICCTGLMGNGAVIWFVGFHIKRNLFTPYILNLAVADIGVLTSFVFCYIFLQAGYPNLPLLACLYLFLFMFSNSQILLTGISIDKFLSLLFPFWHRSQRPPHLSTIVCALIWSFSFLFYAIIITLDIIQLSVYHNILVYLFILTALFCLPLVTISAVTLSIKFCFKSQQRHQGKILMIILLTLLFFFMLDFPFNDLLFISLVFDTIPSNFFLYDFLHACLNSSVNPLIYFLVGRKKEDQPKEITEEGFERRGRLQMENGRHTLLIETHV